MPVQLLHPIVPAMRQQLNPVMRERLASVPQQRSEQYYFNYLTHISRGHMYMEKDSGDEMAPRFPGCIVINPASGTCTPTITFCQTPCVRTSFPAHCRATEHIVSH